MSFEYRKEPVSIEEALIIKLDMHGKMRIIDKYITIGLMLNYMYQHTI